MAESARSWGRPDAAQSICDDLLALAGLTASTTRSIALLKAATEPSSAAVATDPPAAAGDVAPATPLERDA
jgi:hypothetical protein